MHNCNHEHCHHNEGNCGHGHSEGHCNHSGEHHCGGHGEGHCHNGEKQGCGWGGKRDGAGRKCENPKIPFNRRLNEELITKLKNYASEHGITETQALEHAIENL